MEHKKFLRRALSSILALCMMLCSMQLMAVSAMAAPAFNIVVLDGPDATTALNTDVANTTLEQAENFVLGLDKSSFGNLSRFQVVYSGSNATGYECITFRENDDNSLYVEGQSHVEESDLFFVAMMGTKQVFYLVNASSPADDKFDFNFNEVPNATAGSLNGEVLGDRFTVNDPTGKTKVTENAKTLGKKEFTKRFQFGGVGDKTKANLSFTTQNSGVFQVAAIAGSKDDPNRCITVEASDGTIIGSELALGDKVDGLIFNLPKGDTYYVYSTVGACNIYGLTFVPNAKVTFYYGPGPSTEAPNRLGLTATYANEDSFYSITRIGAGIVDNKDITLVELHSDINDGIWGTSQVFQTATIDGIVFTSRNVFYDFTDYDDIENTKVHYDLDSYVFGVEYENVDDKDVAAEHFTVDTGLWF